MYHEAQSAIEALCQERWESPTVVISSVPGEPPLKAPMDFENVVLENAENFEYIYRPRITFLDSKNIGIGGQCKRYYGRLDLTIFHKPGDGVSQTLLAVDDISKYFDNRQYGIYLFYVVEARKLPGVIQGWVQTIASVPFEFDIRS